MLPQYGGKGPNMIVKCVVFSGVDTLHPEETLHLLLAPTEEAQ